MKIPTAEDLMKRYIPFGIQNIKGKGDGKPQYKAEVDIITSLMIDFAKVHVRAAMRAMTRVEYDRATEETVDNLTEEAIKHLYPLTNIK